MDIVSSNETIQQRNSICIKLDFNDGKSIITKKSTLLKLKIFEMIFKQYYYVSMFMIDRDYDNTLLLINSLRYDDDYMKSLSSLKHHQIRVEYQFYDNLALNIDLAISYLLKFKVFNIGGKYWKISEYNVMKIPLLRDLYKNNNSNKKNTFFIDADGDSFERILNYINYEEDNNKNNNLTIDLYYYGIF